MIILVGIYFAVISKVWNYFYAVVIIVTLISSICIFWLPESPRLLHGKAKYDEARSVFTQIAKANGVNPQIPQNMVFKDEVELTSP